MNKQSVQKLGFFLMGMESRIKENREYFKKITAVYKSGTKDYTANIAMDQDGLRMNFMGATISLEIDFLSACLSKIAEEYESAVITYEERGTSLVVEADNKNVKMKTAETEKLEASAAHNETSHLTNRDYFIKVGQADEVLKAIGVLGGNGKVKNDMIRKYNQIDHFIELVHPMLEELAKQYESLTILDCGCGKSYLTFVLNYYVREVMKKPCHFIGLDNSDGVIEASKKIARDLGYHNMEFKAVDIRNYSAQRDIHMVISLHACDTATDEAMALAVKNNARSMVMVPCCHRELLSQYNFQPFSPILKHGILKARMADVLTDGMRSLFLEGMGYRTSVVEYISPLETPKNLMIKAEKKHEANKKAMEEYRRLKELLQVSPALERLVLG